MNQKEVSAEHYKKFCVFLKLESGIVLGDAKQYLVRSRLLPLMQDFDIDDINVLIDKATAKIDRHLTYASIEALTTNETLWFRDTYPYDILTHTLLPQLSQQQSSIKVWSAACSSGQEPYSIAMTFLQYKKSHPSAFPNGIKIVATDLSKEMIDVCNKAEYDELSLSRGLSKPLQQTYFAPTSGKSYGLLPQVTSLVNFRQLNLLSDFRALGTFDVVFCRNVLIYFDKEQKTRILQNISACLPKSGALLLGASESLAGASDSFNMVTQPTGLYYSKV